MTKANLGLPLAGQMAIKAISQGEFEFIAFTTAKTPQAVLNFYMNARMQAAGWTTRENGGCGALANDASVGLGGLCLFAQTAGAKQSELILIIAQDAQTKQTQVFFARVYNPATPPQE
jgi:hypothetical protein